MFQEYGSFIIFINYLPLNVPKAGIESKDQLDPRNNVGNLIATYMLPLRVILTSLVNSAFNIHAIYVNFGPRGYYKLNPRSLPIEEQEKFTAIDELFKDEMIRTRETNIVLGQKINDPSILWANLYATSRIVGCLDGNESIGAASIKAYLKNASPSPEKPIVFVVGQVLGQEIESYIHDEVQVHESKLGAKSQLTIITDELEHKLFSSDLRIFSD